MASQTDYQLKLTGSGLSIERGISEELAKRIAMLVLSDGKTDQQSSQSGAAGTGPSSSGAKNAAGKKSVSEYLLESGATKIPQQVAVIGQYLHTAQNKERFSLEQLLKGFSDAKESKPTNPHRDIGKAIRFGWIASDAKDSYYVTTTGTKAIEERFPRQSRKSRKKGKKQDKKAT